MSANLIVLLAIIVLLALMLVRVPVGLSLITSGLLGIFLTSGFNNAEATAASTPFSATGKYALIVVPMFILMGAIANQTGMAAQLFEVMSRLVGRFPGGLGVAAVLTAGAFAAVSGSSIATVASLGPVAVKELIKRGYNPGFAAGIIAGSGTLGVLIPPSVILVLYAIITGENVAGMLLAGIIPGLVSIGVYSFLVIFHRLIVTGSERGKPLPDAVSTSASNDPLVVDTSNDGSVLVKTQKIIKEEEKVTGGGMAVARIGLVFVLVIGGIYSGIFTATEASAVGAMAILALSLLDIKKDGIRQVFTNFRRSISEAAQLTGSTFFVVVGAAVFTYFLVSARVPSRLSEWISQLDVPDMIVVLLFILLMIPLGMFLDAISVLLIVAPLAYPIVVDELGFSGIWFGILLVKMVELGMITPPVGLNVFVINAAIPEVSITQVFRGVSLFVIGDLIIVMILFAFPSIVTFLPSLANI